MFDLFVFQHLVSFLLFLNFNPLTLRTGNNSLMEFFFFKISRILLGKPGLLLDGDGRQKVECFRECCKKFKFLY